MEMRPRLAEVLLEEAQRAGLQVPAGADAEPVQLRRGGRADAVEAGNLEFFARGVDERPVQPDRPRRSSGGETTYPQDLTEPHQVETGIAALADEVWAWCEKNRWFGRTVTVKLRYADFRTITRSRTRAGPVASRAELAAVSLELVRGVFPLPQPVRLLGVTVSTADTAEDRDPVQPSFDFG